MSCPFNLRSKADSKLKKLGLMIFRAQSLPLKKRAYLPSRKLKKYKKTKNSTTTRSGLTFSKKKILKPLNSKM